MSVKTKLKLMLICVATLAVALFSGCVGEISLEDFLDEKNAKNQSVTYYANLGVFDEKSGKDLKTIYYPENSYVINEDTVMEDGTFNPVRTGYVFSGWYKAQVGDDGKPVYDINGKLIITDVKADLSKPITYGQHLYVCAGWVKDISLNVKLICDVSVTTDKSTYNNGDVISELPFSSKGYATVNQKKSPLTSNDATFLQYYLDEECTQPFVSDRFERPDDENKAVLYAKFIAGKWNIVRTASDVADMLNSTSENQKYYLFSNDDNKTIDLKNQTIALKRDDFNCQIEGNGFTLKNLTIGGTIAVNVQYNVPNQSYSVFGKFSSTASIRNLTIENMSINATIRNTDLTPITFYLISSGADDGAVIYNFNINGANLNIKVADITTLDNIKKIGGVYEDDNWLLGGVTADGEENPTDLAFLNKFSGIQVTDAQLSVSN